jgi:release factor glutamine methyltransferase
MIKNTVSSVLKQAQQQLQSAFDNPAFYAESLLVHVLEKPRTFLHAWPEHELSDQEMTHFNKHLQQALDGKPLAYMTHVQEFWSLPFKVNQHTLIPRPDTELLVATVLEKIPEDKNIALLDLGTGSGAIACALASERPHWHVTATDNSMDALAIAQENATNLNLTQIEFIHSDWYQNVPAKRFDVIVSNPPYIAVDDPAVSVSVKRYEPHQALFAVEDGLAALKTIIQSAPQFLTADGILCVEHGYQQGALVRELFFTAGFRSVETRSDTGSHERVTFGVI